MIVAKQMIKTSQILSVGLSLSIGKVREKLQTNQQPSLNRYVKWLNVPYKVKINRINIVRALLLLSIPKKVKEA